MSDSPACVSGIIVAMSYQCDAQGAVIGRGGLGSKNRGKVSITIDVSTDEADLQGFIDALKNNSTHPVFLSI